MTYLDVIKLQTKCEQLIQRVNCKKVSLKGKHTRSKQPAAFCLEYFKTKTRYADALKSLKQKICQR